MRRKYLQSIGVMFQQLPFVILGFVSLFASTYVFANGFELATNVNIPYAFAIEPVSVERLISLNQSEDAANQSQNSVGNFGEPKYLKLASQTTKLALVSGVVNEGEYLARASVGHFVYLGNAKSGNLGNTLIYVRSSWRSVGQPEAIVVGTNIFVDTNKDWRYMYRVSDVTDLPTGTPYLFPDSAKSHVVLALVNDSNTLIRIVISDFVNLQNIQQ